VARLLLGKMNEAAGNVMNRLLIVAILLISAAPVYAQGQQPNAAELAQKVASVISGDKAKTQTYCQILDLSDELDQVDQQKDRKKAEELSQKLNELQKKLGPEYLALLEATEHVDPNSKDGQEIASIFDKLDSSCGD
jgi:flagellar motility protein MotE (MotC chaperone)